MSRSSYYTVKSLFVAIFIWNAAHAQKWLTESAQDKNWPAELDEQAISQWAPHFSEATLGTQQLARPSEDLDEFSKQVSQLISNETITEERLRQVSQVLHDLKKVFEAQSPGSRVIVFGSLAYGLALRNSDVDCTLLLARRTALGPALTDAARDLRLSPSFTDVAPIPWARIPVLTFKHTPTQIKIDLSVNNFAGIQLSNMLRYLLHLNDRIYKLAFVVKHWADKLQITTAENPGLSNYGLNLMVIFYLQQRNMMPSIASLQNNAVPFFDDEWNMGFCETEYKMQNYVPLDLLLGEFFKYYADFDYDRYIVSPYAGYPVEKRSFSELKQVPHEFGLYVQNVRAGLSKPLSLGIENDFVLQDAFIHNQNVAEFLDTRPDSTFFTQFQIAARKFRENKIDFLETLLEVDSSNIS